MNSYNDIIGKSEKGKVTGLCYLASININEYYKMLPALDSEDIKDEKAVKRRQNFILRAVTALDNTIETDYYPVKEGVEAVAKAYRYIGLGTHNYATMFAELGINWNDQEAKELTAYVYDMFSQEVINDSCDLAIDRGAADGWTDGHTKWGETLPYWQGNEEAKKLFKYRPDEQRLYDLNEKVRRNGVRNCQMMAIAPTACGLRSNKMRTYDGIKTLTQIMEEGGIDYKQIENSQEPGWYDLDRPIKVPSLYGTEVVTRVWYNGAKPVKIFNFDNTDDQYGFTLNHQLGVQTEHTDLVANGKSTSGIKQRKMTFKPVCLITVGDTITSKDSIDGTKIQRSFNDTGTEHTWDVECNGSNTYLLANGCVSHNTSGKAAGVSEGIDPVTNVFRKEGGVITGINMIHDDAKVRNQYTQSFSISDDTIIELAAIRQLFIDQAQSVTLFCNNTTENKIKTSEVFRTTQKARKLGMKSLYYVKFLKEEADNVEECESCT